VHITPDKEFFQRADAVIDVANNQLSEASRGKVSASCMFASARFNAWVTATGHESAEAMAAAKQQAIDYFIGEYRDMLERNFDEYITNFDKYMQRHEA